MLDGNARWAESRGQTVADGHRAGSRALRPIVETAIDVGIESLAVYAFSTENWSRPPEEVEALMEIFGETIDRELPDLAAQGVRTVEVVPFVAKDVLQLPYGAVHDATASTVLS